MGAAALGAAGVAAWLKNEVRVIPARPATVRDVTGAGDALIAVGDEVDVESYLFVTQIIDRKPSTLSSGFVHWTLVRTTDGYRVKEQHTVLDSIESAPFQDVEFVAGRTATW